MNKYFSFGIFGVIILSGYFLGGIIFSERNDGGITIEDVVSNYTNYIDQEVELRGSARMHSSRDWVILEDKGYYIYVKHNIRDAYFKYGERYIVIGDVKFGKVFGVEEDTYYIDAKKSMVRNNSLSWA